MKLSIGDLQTIQRIRDMAAGTIKFPHVEYTQGLTPSEMLRKSADVADRKAWDVKAFDSLIEKFKKENPESVV